MQDVLLQHGYEVSDIIPDGKLHRFKLDSSDDKNSGWYVCHRNFSPKTGQEFFVLLFGDWRSCEFKKHCTLGEKLSPEESRLADKQIKDAQRKFEKEKKDKQEQTALEVQAFWEQAPKDGVSEYLVKKKIDATGFDLRFDSKGNIYVPIRDTAGKIWSCEKIDGEGNKRFHPGGRVSGGFFLFGELQGQRFYLAEGFATAASIANAVGSSGVVCCFSASNIEKVLLELRKNNHQAEFIICGDDDRGKDRNAGRLAATALEEKYPVTAIFPKFKTDQGKDWNDLRCQEGLDEVRKQILGAEPRKMDFVLALGFNNKEYFFTSSQNKQIVSLTRPGKDGLMGLMPIEYWEALYPGAGKARVDWDQAASSLMESARHKGIFKPQNVRGAGVWRDDNRTVVHMGDHLLVDGNRVELGEIKSRYFYTLGANLAKLKAPLTAQECEIFTKACQGFKWLKPDFGYLLAGSLVCARVCGALPIRPHVWITGGASTGKTTLLQHLIRPILGENTLYVQGGTSEAGIRQSQNADATPVIFDEFEQTGKKSSEVINAVLELMRASWSDSDAQVVKGSSGGSATSYRVRFSAFVSSIRTKLTNDADLGRFARIELAPHGNDAEHWKELSSYLSEMTPEYGDRLFSRTIGLLDVLLANYRVLKKVLGQRVNQRFGDQYGMILAGYSLLLQDDVINEAQAKVIADNVLLDEEKDEARVMDHQDCLTWMLTKRVRLERTDGKSFDYAVGEAIEKLFRQSELDLDNGLQRIGIKVTVDGVFVASKATELETLIFKDTRWSQTWANSLSRLEGASRRHNQRFAGTQLCCIKIPRGHFC